MFVSADEVVVTGIGMVTPLGATAKETAEAWRAGRSAARATIPELADTPLAEAAVAAPPPLEAAARLGNRRMLKYMSNAALLGCVAAREAWTAAAIERRFPPERVGLFAASGLAAADINEVLPMLRESVDETGRLSCRLLGARGLAATNPLLSFKILANMPPCLVSLLLGIRGPNYILTPWESQAGAALVEAWRAVAEGRVDCALAGAGDSAAHPATLVYLHQAGLLRPGSCAASAGAYLALERSATAKKDGIPARAIIDSIGVTAADVTAFDPLAERMGRTFAAAPALALGLACLTGEHEARVVGNDRRQFYCSLRALQ